MLFSSLANYSAPREPVWENRSAGFSERRLRERPECVRLVDAAHQRGSGKDQRGQSQEIEAEVVGFDYHGVVSMGVLRILDC